LKRCFGRDEKIVDCDWSYLETLRTLKEPHEPMPRLKDLLEYMAQPGLEDIWILLDIKVPWPALMEPFQKNRIDKWEKLDNRVDDVMRLIGSTIAEVKPTKPWNQRVVLGCWAVCTLLPHHRMLLMSWSQAKYLPYCTQYLPGFPITHIGFSVAYARQFLKVPNVSFNMLQKTMIGPLGNRFMRDCKRLQRPLYLWTVNDADWMKWSIKKGVDGVITDDPQKFLDVCKDYDDDIPIRGIKMRELPSLIWINLLILVFGFLFRLRYGFRIDLEKLHSDRQGSRPAMKLA
jgi:phosphatidylglycerol phospholipase C